MSIKHYLSAAAALAMFAACSDYDPGMSNQAVDLTEAEIETIKEYTANFVERYGEIDPNHTWGFGALASTKEEMETRSVNTERNQWLSSTEVVKGKDEGGHEIRELEWNVNTGILPEGAIIPGMPSSVDGKYHTEEGDMDDLPKSTSQRSIHPYGDVTYEEIIYVSNYFRSNKFTDSQVPPFTEFFIQEISHDEDRKTYPNGKWIDEELPVIKSDGTVENGEDPITFGMNYLVVYTNGGSANGEHINNFNKGGYTPGGSVLCEGGSNPIDEDDPDHTPYTNVNTRNIKYWTTNDGYTTGFGYYNSDDSQTYDHYVLRHLTFDILQSDGTEHHYDGYYLAFDYEFHDRTSDGKTSDLERDGYYSNWILKLSPADPNFYDDPDPDTRTVTHERRVMCEDLGSTFDFDFNDLVFDVKYTREEQKNQNGQWEPVRTDGTYTATITLQAAGGTLPIYIKNFDGTTYDVHSMLGGTLSNGSYSPVNVGTGSTHVPVTLPSIQVSSDDTNPDDIEILVYSNDDERSATHQLELPSSEGLQYFGMNLAPQKICVPVNTRWTKEYQQIEWAYPYFHEWVNRENGDFGFDKPNDWTTTGVDTQYLY